MLAFFRAACRFIPQWFQWTKERDTWQAIPYIQGNQAVSATPPTKSSIELTPQDGAEGYV